MQFSNPHDALRYHVSGAVERGEAESITEVPRYMDMTPDELRAAYREERRRLHNIGTMAQSVTSPKGRKMLARQTGPALERFDLICNVARKRGIDLLAG